LTGGEALAQQLVLEGITDVFGIPGVQLDWATDALHGVQERVRYWVPRHEQTAAYMADGYARSTGRIGVCMVVPGPGLLNAMSGLATAWSCSSRVLAVVGQIPSGAIGRRLGLLHEIEGQSQILAKVTKWHAAARSVHDVPLLVREAVRQIRSGRPRPVAVEIPSDILAARAEVGLIEPANGVEERLRPDAALIEAAARMLEQARFPVIFAGGGALAADATAELECVAEKLQAPVVMSDYGRGVLSDRHPLALNTLGGRAVFPHADVALVVGSRFADANAPAAAWPQDRLRYIYLNTDADAWAPPRVATLAIRADAKLGLAAIADALPGTAPSRATELQKVRAWVAVQADRIEPQRSWSAALRAAIPEDGVLVQDLTQVGYFSRTFYPLYRPHTGLTPGHQGTLGFSYPTALGVAAGNPGRAVVCVTGDGGFGYGLADLATAAKYRLGVVAVVFNDQQFANVKHMQAKAFGRATGYELRNPDFGRLAAAFGVDGATVQCPEDLAVVLPRAISSGRPWLIEARVGEMADPWHLVRLRQGSAAPDGHEPPPNPLGAPPT
jgi:acetolactate synthase-1/2/3 large subunit